MSSDNKKNIALIIMALLLVVSTIIFVTQYPKLSAAKKVLENNDTEINKSLKALAVDTAAYGEKARSFEKLYQNSVAQLTRVEADRDSLALAFTKIKPQTHAQIISIAQLGDSATNSLYIANLKRLNSLSR